MPRGFRSQRPLTKVTMSTEMRLLAPPVQQGLNQRHRMHLPPFKLTLTSR